MITYLDSSIVLRVVLGQPGAFREWRSVESGIASALVDVECLRTLDRLRLVEGNPDTEIVQRREAVYRVLETVTVVDVTRPILARVAAAGGFSGHAQCHPPCDRRTLA